MKRIMTPLIISLVYIWAGRVSALPIREVYSQDAQGISGLNIELKVNAGYGLTIDFIPTSEKILQVWIADPSHFAFTSNSGCIQKLESRRSNTYHNQPAFDHEYPTTPTNQPNTRLADYSGDNASNQECSHEGATVLFLRQIKPINFPNITSSKDGSTELTVITKGDDGQQKQYQFRLIPASGKPAYTSLVIKPDLEKPTPLLLRNKSN